jgi:hypothetical protein
MGKEIIDTRTKVDEEGDLVDPWDDFINGDLPFDDLSEELKTRARKVFGV